jgi:hypothetical protein
MGVSMGGTLKPDDSFEFQRAAVAIDFAPDMPQSTKDSFRRLQQTHIYGILCYDLFTVAGEEALLVLEQGLGA